MSEIVLLARLTAHAGKRDELVALLRTALALVQEHEPGSLLAAVHTLADEPDVVVLYERYASAEALQEHRGNYERIPAYAQFRAAMDALLAAPLEVQRLDLVDGFVRAAPQRV